MNFNLYLFGNPGGQYAQIPDDYLKNIVEPFLKNLKGSKTVILRKENLVHYIFSQRIDDNGYIGFCIIFNSSYIANIHDFINFCSKSIEKYLVIEGNILSYDDDGNPTFLVSSFDESRDVSIRIKSAFNVWLENKAVLRNITKSYDGTSSFTECDDSANDSQIENLHLSNNTVIVNGSVALNDSYVGNIISILRSKYVSASNLVEQLKSENSRLLRKKKQFTFVIILLAVVSVLCIITYYINDSLGKARNDICSLKDSITSKNTKITILNHDLDSTEYVLKKEKVAHKQAADSLHYINEIIHDHIPLIVKSTEFNWGMGVLKIKYHGFVTKDVTLSVKSISDDREQLSSNSTSTNIYNGENEMSIYVSSSLNSGKWHTFYISINGIVVGGDRH